MSVNRHDLMSRLRGDRQSAPSMLRGAEKPNVNKPKKEKWIPLSGWQTDNMYPDNDFKLWAKKTEEIDLRETRRIYNNRPWDPFLCTLLKKCRAIENIEEYVKNSLSVCLKPPPPEPEVTKVSLKHTKSENFANSKEYAKILEEVNKTNGIDLLKQCIGREIKNQKSAQVKSQKDKEKNTEKKSDNKPVKAGNNKDLQSEKVSVEQNVVTEQDVPKNAEDVIKTTEESNEYNINNRTTENDNEEKPHIKHETVPVPKFGYTQAKQGNLLSYNSNDRLEKLMHASSTGNLLRTPENEQVEYETISTISSLSNTSNIPSRSNDVTGKRTLHATTMSFVPGFNHKRSYHTRLQHRPGMSRSETNIKELPLDYVNATTLENDIAESMSGMSIASIKSARRAKSSQSSVSQPRSELHSQSYQDMTTQDEDPQGSQKQVMLVLKKVTLQENELDEAAESANGAAIKRNALTSAIARKYGLLTHSTQSETITELPPRGISGKTNKTVNSSQRLSNSGQENGRLSSIGQCFPIGELLPAVDSSIRNSMPVRHYRSMEPNGKENTEKTMAVTGKDRMVPYEDSLIMMKEGVEMLRIRERAETLGPQGFRPQQGRTPLHRARENAHKRLYTQIEGKPKRIGDSSKTRWESSTGTLYNGTNSRNGSRPTSVKQTEEEPTREKSAKLSRKWRETSAEKQAERQAQSGRALNVHNSRLQMQHVSQALAARLTDLAKLQNT